MDKKEITTKENLMDVLDLLDRLNIKYWIDGGWGVDILLGKQNRVHRDIDVNFDGKYSDLLLEVLEKRGYAITTDWRPARIELYHPELGYLDIHPFVLNGNGTAKQADLNGGWYSFEETYFSEAAFEGRIISCMSVQAQRLFHSGYEQREVDVIDMKNLVKLLPETGTDCD